MFLLYSKFIFVTTFFYLNKIFSISFIECLLAIKPSVASFDYVFISLLSEVYFYRIMDYSYFIFSTKKMLFYCLLASNVSGEKSLIFKIIVPLCVMYTFSLVASNIFSFIFDFQHYDYDMSGCDFLGFIF